MCLQYKRHRPPLCMGRDRTVGGVPSLWVAARADPAPCFGAMRSGRTQQAVSSETFERRFATRHWMCVGITAVVFVIYSVFESKAMVVLLKVFQLFVLLINSTL